MEHISDSFPTIVTTVKPKGLVNNCNNSNNCYSSNRNKKEYIPAWKTNEIMEKVKHLIGEDTTFKDWYFSRLLELGEYKFMLCAQLAGSKRANSPAKLFSYWLKNPDKIDMSRYAK